MLRTILKSKINRVKVTEANLHYEGSITIDSDLMKAVDIIEREKVEVLNLNNGQRIETYAIEGKKNSGIICLNGPAARFAHVGDQVIILSYILCSDSDVKKVKFRKVCVDENNRRRD